MNAKRSLLGLALAGLVLFPVGVSQTMSVPNATKAVTAASDPCGEGGHDYGDGICFYGGSGYGRDGEYGG